jgi:hypothetical protein
MVLARIRDANDTDIVTSVVSIVLAVEGALVGDAWFSIFMCAQHLS